MSDAEVLDIVQSSAFFAWANRLMLSLGGPERPGTGDAAAVADQVRKDGEARSAK